MILRTIAALFGVIEMLFPKKVTELTMNVMVKGEPEYEFKPWVYTLARIEGFAIVVFAFLWSKGHELNNK